MTFARRAAAPSPVTLGSPRFRARFGVSLGTYHRRVRVQWAAQQLAAGDAPIGRIALQAGFADHAHFSRVFKAAMGVTPRAYARASRRSE
jgi:AraC-like DNA-binding protein